MEAGERGSRDYVHAGTGTGVYVADGDVVVRADYGDLDEPAIERVDYRPGEPFVDEDRNGVGATVVRAPLGSPSAYTMSTTDEPQQTIWEFDGAGQDEAQFHITGGERKRLTWVRPDGSSFEITNAARDSYTTDLYPTDQEGTYQLVVEPRSASSHGPLEDVTIEGWDGPVQ